MQQVLELDQGVADHSARWMVHQEIGLAKIGAVLLDQRPNRNIVYPGHDLDGPSRPQQLTGISVEQRVRRGVEGGHGVTHLPDSLPDRLHVLGSVPGRQSQGTFDLPLRRSSKVRNRRPHDRAFEPLESEQAPDRILDRVADPRRVPVAAKPGQLRDTNRRCVRHGSRRPQVVGSNC